MTEIASFKERVEALPKTPGVYLMKSAEGEILYIGKAASLRDRVQSYLRNRPFSGAIPFLAPARPAGGGDAEGVPVLARSARAGGGRRAILEKKYYGWDRGQMPKVTVMMNRVEDLDYIETPTEVDALLLEADLIHKYQPRYNQELKDDKSYPLLKITAEEFPRIHMTRNKSDRKALYYGPYTDARLLRQAVTLINTLFPLRKCRKLPAKACLYYHIGQCLAPCIKPEVRPAYDRLVTEVRNFLGGGKKSFMEYLAERMFQAARELRFEDAQFFKEEIQALSRLKKKRFSPEALEIRVAFSATLELKRLLGAEKLPEKIVGFDVSNIQGNNAVAAKAAFYRELPDKLGYRRYQIRSVAGIDDYAMIQEALGRMLIALKEGRESFIPDLIVIDGGKGHLNAALEVLRREGFEEIELMSLAKRFETVYSVRTGGEVIIPKDSPALHLLQKVRDEAHRFAITYHRSLKEKEMIRSRLDSIPGIGEKRKRIILEQFDSLDELCRSGLNELAGLPRMNRPTAEAILSYLKKPTPNNS